VVPTTKAEQQKNKEIQQTAKYNRNGPQQKHKPNSIENKDKTEDRQSLVQYAFYNIRSANRVGLFVDAWSLDRPINVCKHYQHMLVDQKNDKVFPATK